MFKDWFNFWADITPDKTAIVTPDNGKAYTYSDINNKSIEIVHYLHVNYGIGKGDRICILAENCIEYIYLLATAMKNGMILIPLNYRMTAFEIGKLYKDSNPKLFLYEEQFNDQLSEVPDNISEPISRLEETSPAHSYSDSFKYSPIYLDDIALILYTSGSTGVPKGVLYTYKMMFWNSVNTSVSLNISTDTTTVICMPPFHTGGWNVLLTPVAHHGGTCILMKKFDAHMVLNLLSEYKCDQFMAVPTMLKMISEQASFNEVDLSRLKYIIVGGEAMPIPLIKLYEEKSILIRQGFGMTEVGPNIFSLKETEALRKIGSIGKPNMYIEVCLRDLDGNIVGDNTKGELCFKGDVVTPGYFQNQEATQFAIRDGWLHSGDVAIRDEEGFYYIVDRIKNMFISGAENVYPAEIESVLLQIEGVSEAAVIGVPDSKWGEVGKAFLVWQDTSKEVEIIKTELLKKLSKYKIPKHYHNLDTLPKTASGKIDRVALRQL